MQKNQSESNHSKSLFLDKSSWQKHFVCYKLSGLTKVSYSNQHDLNYHQFIYWCRKFEAEESSSVSCHSSDFIPVKIKSNLTTTTTLCTLELANGKRWLIHDISALTMIIKEF